MAQETGRYEFPGFRIQTLFIHDQPVWVFEDQVADFEGRPGNETELYDPDILWTDLRAAYQQMATDQQGMVVDQPDFQERVLNLKNPEAIDSGEDLVTNWVTSYDIQAARAGVIDPSSFHQLAAIGITVTGDNQVVVGFRGGEITVDRIDRYGSGLYGVPPGGSVKFKPDYTDPIAETISEEFLGEVSMRLDVVEQSHIGVFTAGKPGPTGMKFLGMIKTDATLEQVAAENKRGREREEVLLGQGLSKLDARAVLRHEMLPYDAWEHYSVVGVQNDPESVERFVYSRPHLMSGIGAGSLLTYAQYLREA